jgi:RNA polymerase sigma-70 factor (ECF subfamily)
VIDADAEASHGRARFVQVFLAQRARMEALVNRRIGCRATAGPGAGAVPALLAPPRGQGRGARYYLLRSAGNLAIDHLRSEGSRDRVAEGLQHTDDEAFAQAPEQALEVDHDLQRIEAALRLARAHPADLPAQPHPRLHLRRDRQGHAAVPERRGKAYDARPRSVQGECRRSRAPPRRPGSARR